MEELVFGRRYRVTEKLGSGGMAEVYKAVDEVLGRTVAIKVLHSRYASDAAFVARFRQEAQAAANLSHPNIVNIYDWGRDDDVYFIVMEFVRGTDLKSIVTERGAIDPVKAAEYGSQVCAALSVAHGYDIIHRDIKPHNIVLTPDEVVKVMDFGIARAGNTTMTQTGSVLGTAQYISPEQAQGRPLSAASDLYSLGVVLYELTTGHVPFDADTPVAAALKQVNEAPVPPRQVNDRIPPALEAVIMRAMAKHPADRYASADEMRRDLQRVVSGRPVEAAPRMGETTVMPAVDGGSRSQGSPRVRPVPQRRSPWPWIALAAVLLTMLAVGAWAMGYLGGTETVIVPTLTGLTQSEAEDAIEAIELVVGEVEMRFSDTVEPGQVIDQSPVPGAEVDIGSEIKLVVSQGLEEFEIPDLTGMSENEAIAAIGDAGFELNTITREYSTEVEPDLVISQEPEAGTLAAVGTRITLVVSRGTELKKVPDTIGTPLSDAKEALESLGFVVVVTEEYSSTVEEGTVISQRPSGGVSIDAGSEVTLVVSLGEEIISVPDVIGLTEADATDDLEAVDLRVLVNYVSNPLDGIVDTQNPVPGASAKPGDTVTIWVGVAPPGKPEEESTQ